MVEEAIINEQALEKEKVKDIAIWMLEKCREDGVLYQDHAAGLIREKFGEEYIPDNNRGNPSIRKDILAAFRKLTEGLVIWSKSERRWRLRAGYDEPGTRQEA
jgi:hypothetical protein